MQHATVSYTSCSFSFVLSIPVLLPMPVAVRSKAWFCGHSLAGIAGSNPAGGMVVSVL